MTGWSDHAEWSGTALTRTKACPDCGRAAGKQHRQSCPAFLDDSGASSVYCEKAVEVAGPSGPAPAPTVTRADVLNRAADLLEEFGWCQGTLGSKAHGEFCILGAAYQAARDLGVTRGYGVYCEGAYWVGLDEETAFRWNDDPRRTKPEVVARLRELAKDAT